MFNLGFGELILLAIIALIVIGPKQLPEVAVTLGRFINELKRAANDLSGGFMNSVQQSSKPSQKPYPASQPHQTQQQTQQEDQPPEAKSETGTV